MANNQADSEVLIKILTAFESGGIDAAKAAAEELKKTVSENSDAGKELSFVSNLMAKDATRARAIFSGLSGVMHGGMRSAQGLTTALRGIGIALGASGPVMLGLTAVGLAVTTFNKWQKAAEDAKKATEEAAAAEIKAAEEAEAAIEKLNQAKLETARQEVERVRKELEGAAKAANELNRRLMEREDAAMALEYANIDKSIAMGEMSETDGSYQKSRLSLQNEIKQRQREQKSEQEAIEREQKKIEDLVSASNAADETARKMRAVADAGMNEAENAQLQSIQVKRDAARSDYNKHRSLKYEAPGKLKIWQQIEEELIEFQNEIGKRMGEREQIALDAESTASIEAQKLADAQDYNSDSNNNIRESRHKMGIAETEIRSRQIALETEQKKWSKKKDDERLAEYKKIKEEEEKKEKAQAEAEKKRQKEEEEREKKMPPQERGQRIITAGTKTAKIQDAQANDYPLGSDVDRIGRLGVQDALTKAVEGIESGIEAEAIIQQLSTALAELGAVIPDMSRVVSEVGKLKSDYQTLQSQIKGMR